MPTHIYLNQVIGEPEDSSHVQQILKEVERLGVHPALLQNFSERSLQGLTDWLAGWQKVPVRNGLLTLDGRPQGQSSLLKHICTHVLQNRAHDNHTGARERDFITLCKCANGHF